MPSGSSVPPAIAGLSSSPPPVDLVALAVAQAACPDCQCASLSPALHVSEVTLHGSPLLVDTSPGVFRPLVPAAFPQPIFDAIHNLAHPGIRATKWLISNHFVWPCLASQVAAWCKDCQQCQRAKVLSQPAAPPSHIANPTQRFSHIHIDLFDALTGQMGVKRRFTTPYHPQSKGLVERFHRRLKEALQAQMTGSDWMSHLPWVLLGLRAAPREDSGISAAELVYGCPLLLPGQFLTAAEPPPSAFVRQMLSSITCIADRSGCAAPPPPPLQALQSAAFVYLRSPPLLPGLSPAYRGPYRVRVPGVKYFVMDIGGTPNVVSVDHLKPHLRKSPDRPCSGPSPWSSTRAAPWLASVPSPQLRGWGGGYCGGRQRGSEH